MAGFRFCQHHYKRFGEYHLGLISRFQALDQVSLVCMLQDTFKAMESTPETHNLGLVIFFHSSIEAANDDPVARHDRDHNSDAATRDMDFIPTSPLQVSSIPQGL